MLPKLLVCSSSAGPFKQRRAPRQSPSGRHPSPPLPPGVNGKEAFLHEPRKMQSRYTSSYPPPRSLGWQEAFFPPSDVPDWRGYECCRRLLPCPLGIAWLFLKGRCCLGWGWVGRGRGKGVMAAPVEDVRAHGEAGTVIQRVPAPFMKAGLSEELPMWLMDVSIGQRH